MFICAIYNSNLQRQILTLMKLARDIDKHTTFRELEWIIGSNNYFE